MGHDASRIARALGVHPQTVQKILRGDADTVSPRLRSSASRSARASSACSSNVPNSALVPIVQQNRYLEGNSLIYASRALSFVAGPSVGGLLVHLL